MDGTLTQGNKFSSNLIQTLEKLGAAEIDVLIVTGRSAGWVNAIATYLPVVGAIAENGGLLNNIPVITHESDLTPGLANRINMNFAQKICTTFPDTLQHLPKDKGEFAFTQG